jgi:hypothetical protein
MSTPVVPPPDRFSVRRTGEPDRLAPAITVPAAPETEATPTSDPVPAAPESTPREPVPAGGG